MSGEFTATLRGFRFLCALLLTAALPLAGGNHTKPTPGEPSDRDADARTYLKQVCERCARANYYRVEVIEEDETIGDFSRNWNKCLTTAIVVPGNRYRFERRCSGVWWIQVSDGKTEWIYQPAKRQYTERPTPASGPSRFKSPWSYEFSQLIEAQDTVKDLYALPASVRSAKYLPDEIIELNGEYVSCNVVEAQRKDPFGRDITAQLTFWIDKETHVIRKIHEHMEGTLILNEPQEHYVNDKITSFIVADLNSPSVADSVFAFNAPSDAKLVKEFEDPAQRGRQRNEAANNIVGKPAPPINLQSADGKTVSLQSFQGKPVLLDFWATWCGPCVVSMPSLERLYRETADKGLVMLSIDEDGDAKEATDFLAEHKEPWQNFHDNGEVARSFPPHGIPYLVLVDSSGKVVYAAAGFDEPELRAALAKLGPGFASLADTPKP